tara:strand:+ start:39 stop:785 length:747 start_codon:yes stop_codon:yes gene_type:complete
MGKKLRKLAAKLLRKDEGKVTASDLLRIQNKIKRKKGSKLKLGQIADVAANRTDKTVDKSTIRKARRNKKLDPLREAVSKAESKVEIPRAEDSKDKPFKKYKPQGKKIEKLSEARLALKKEKVSEGPKTLKGSKKILKDFREGRKDRRKEIRKIEKKVERPDFKEYKQNIKDIRKGEGEAATYAYTTRFKNLGKEFGIKYGDEARRKRTKSRLGDLKSGLTGTYETSAKASKKRRKAGKAILESMKKQ